MQEAGAIDDLVKAGQQGPILGILNNTTIASARPTLSSTPPTCPPGRLAPAKALLQDSPARSDPVS